MLRFSGVLPEDTQDVDHIRPKMNTAMLQTTPSNGNRSWSIHSLNALTVGRSTIYTEPTAQSCIATLTTARGLTITGPFFPSQAVSWTGF